MPSGIFPRKVPLNFFDAAGLLGAFAQDGSGTSGHLIGPAIASEFEA
jgi:hypothetical protein